MDHFRYRSGELYAEDIPLSRLAKEVGTPFYCYSTATLVRHYKVFTEAFADGNAMVCYAVKANSNQSVLATLAQQGSGADVVSEGEIRRALAAGILAEKIVFSGVGKKASEMAYALQQGIFQFNVESVPELETLSAVAVKQGREAAIALRVNPDVDAGTHVKISTGRKENKFGIALEEAQDVYALARDLPGIRVQGVSVHIGSQLTAMGPFEEAFWRVVAFVRTLREAGHTITTLDLGGGLGIPYSSETPPLPTDYAESVRRITEGLDCHLIFEPGRMIVGNAGILLTQVIYVKEAGMRRFAIVDAAMNDLLRPSLYNAYHDMIPVMEATEDSHRYLYDIVGPVCESGDIFAEQRELPEMQAGDLIAFRSAGAYGAVMASSYNSRLMIPEVLVNGSDYAVIRPRPDYDAMLAAEPVAGWLRSA